MCNNRPMPISRVRGQIAASYIHCNHRILMQRMKADAAPLRIVNRVGEEMIQVDEQCRNHDQPGLPERPSVECPGNERGREGVQNEMNDGSNGHRLAAWKKAAQILGGILSRRCVRREQGFCGVLETSMFVAIRPPNRSTSEKPIG